jgi:hypothetical protein
MPVEEREKDPSEVRLRLKVWQILDLIDAAEQKAQGYRNAEQMHQGGGSNIHLDKAEEGTHFLDALETVASLPETSDVEDARVTAEEWEEIAKDLKDALNEYSKEEES